MKTTLSLLTLVIAVLVAAGCSGSQNTPTVTTAPPPTVAVSRSNVICNNLSLSLDQTLGSGYECQAIAESSSTGLPAVDIHPQTTEVSFKNYPFTDSVYTPHIDVFPIQRYAKLVPDLVPARLADLQALIAGSSKSGAEWPLLPVFSSKQMFVSQTAVISFQNGKGIRYLTQYTQGIVPINNQEIFYSFQGLTADGQYWVSAILPIRSPLLLADGKNPPGGQSMEAFAQNYRTYIADTTARLNAEALGNFTPGLTMLDGLISSMVIQP